MSYVDDGGLSLQRGDNTPARYTFSEPQLAADVGASRHNIGLARYSSALRQSRVPLTPARAAFIRERSQIRPRTRSAAGRPYGRPIPFQLEPARLAPTYVAGYEQLGDDLVDDQLGPDQLGFSLKPPKKVRKFLKKAALPLAIGASLFIPGVAPLALKGALLLAKGAAAGGKAAGGLVGRLLSRKVASLPTSNPKPSPVPVIQEATPQPVPIIDYQQVPGPQSPAVPASSGVGLTATVDSYSDGGEIPTGQAPGALTAEKGQQLMRGAMIAGVAVLALGAAGVFRSARRR